MANSPTNVTFVDYVTPVTAAWLNNVNNVVNNSLPVTVISFGADPTGILDSTAAFNLAAASNKTITVPDGTYKLLGTVTTGTAAWDIAPKVQFTGTWPNLKRGFFTNINTPQFGNGANVWRFNDRVMIGTSTQYDGSNDPVYPNAIDWIGSLYPVFGTTTGAFEYLLTNATLAVGSPLAQSGIVAYGRTSDQPSTTGGGGYLALASGVVNDNSTTLGINTWNAYLTCVKTATATANSVGIEIDMCNLGATVPIFPSQMFTDKQIVGIGLCAGGELQNTQGVIMGTSSAALTIASNDILGNAKWEKGIVFHQQGLVVTNSQAHAINLGIGHGISWWDTNNFATNAIFSTTSSGTTVGNSQSIQFSDSGLLVTDSNGNPQFRVNNGSTAAANYIMIQSAITSGTPGVVAQGSDANINLSLGGKGTGQIVLNSTINQLKIASGVFTTATAGSASALPSVPAGYAEMMVNGTLVKVPYYGV